MPDGTTMTFDPAEDARAFRDALGAFATGITVITCRGANGARVGITANSFASLSLDPPLVLWSPAKTSSRYPVFMAVRHFAVHVLGAEQADLSARFTKGPCFDGLPEAVNADGVPVLAGVLARFDCTLWAAPDGGDHTIIIGRVTHAETRPGEPLVFARGRYRTLADIG